MGDLEHDTRVAAGDEPGRFRAHLHEGWNIWGPNGGYVAAIVLRAAGASTSFRRPASLAVQFLGVGANDDVDLTVTSLRRTRRAEALSVAMVQGDRPLASGLVWVVTDGLDGLAHAADTTLAPSDPDSVLNVDERLAAIEEPPSRFAFWDNLELRPLDWEDQWPPPVPRPPETDGWFRFRPTATFTDPFTDAARSVVLVDLNGWAAAMRPHAYLHPEPDTFPWVAPSLDVTVRFHRAEPAEEWLRCRSTSPASADGLVGVEGGVWSRSGHLLATGGSQLLCTPAPR